MTVSPALDPERAPLTIMFIRHGEKPSDHGVPHGINHHGEHDAHSLSVRGWTRAGGLAGLLAHGPWSSHPHVTIPKRIVATGPTPEAKSRRELDTATPLAQRLNIVVEDHFAHGHEDLLRQSILEDPRPALIVWHHGTLSALVRSFPLANGSDVPRDWPNDRFDLIWILTRQPSDAAYQFISVNQMLLEGDVGTVAPAQ